MHKITKIIRLVFLFPFSILYGFILFVRNRLFDFGIIPSKSYRIPVIVVGNITVGGTGKTPHIEYLIELLGRYGNPAVISRGYKRKTKGYLLAGSKSTPMSIGDEPYQIYRKFPGIHMAVCEKRAEGIDRLTELNNDIFAVLLDDAFQHRFVKPGLSIVLIDYNRPIFSDYVFPAGNLRDNKREIRRADILVITKSPPKISEAEKDYWTKKIKLSSKQKLYFSCFRYGDLTPLFPENEKALSLQSLKNNNTRALLLTGIANPKPLEDFLHENEIECFKMQFSDHHNFDKEDFIKIKQKFESTDSGEKIIITTEKDAVRLLHSALFPHELKPVVYYIPVRVQFIEGNRPEFDNNVLAYVGKN